MSEITSRHMVKLSDMNCKAVIFDMDGTMVDNMMVHHSAWQQKLKELGMDLPLEEVMQKVHGINEEILERLFGDKLSAEQRRIHSFDKEARYREIFKDSLDLINGLDKFKAELKNANIPMAIGSAAPPENIDFVLDNLAIRDQFDVILHARHVSKGKPDPEIYLKIMDSLNVAPQECVVFEDSPVGAEAGVRSGAETIVITTTHEPDEFKHLPAIKHFIKDYSEVSF